MRLFQRCAVIALTIGLAGSLWADLQNVEVGGSLQIRGSYYSPEGTGTIALFESRGNSLAFVEQRTRLHFLADFTDHVKVVLEFDSYDVWGEDFRSNHVTGVDSRAATADDVEVYQSYIEMEEVLGRPITIRIGRQEIMLGSEWLVGNNDTPFLPRGLSFDGVRVIYEEETWGLTAFVTKLADNSPIEEDGDVDFYGVYATYKGLPDWELDAYWLYLRDGRGSRLGFPFDTSNTGLAGRLLDNIEDFFGVDQYSDTTEVHTLGLRVSGMEGQWDFAGEFAFQKGEAPNQVKTFFSPDPATSGATPYGEDDAEFTRLAYDVEVGYSFDTPVQPRLFVGLAWFEGEDRREESFGDWLHTFYPFHETDASISFNRLFSDWKYSEFLANTDLSNVFMVRGGVNLQPTDKVDAMLILSYFQPDSEGSTNGVLGVPFNSAESDDSLGLEAGLYFGYDYSEDLRFDFGYAHFFADDGLDSNARILKRVFPKLGGSFIAGNGLIRVGGVNQDDADYIFAETSIRF